MTDGALAGIPLLLAGSHGLALSALGHLREGGRVEHTVRRCRRRVLNHRPVQVP